MSDHAHLPVPPFADEVTWRSVGQDVMCDGCPDALPDEAPCRYWARGLPCPSPEAVHA